MIKLASVLEFLRDLALSMVVGAVLAAIGAMIGFALAGCCPR